MPCGAGVSELVGEFIGTFLYCLTIPLASIGIGSLAPIAVAYMLMAMLFSFADISGGHFNPALTFSVFILRKVSLAKFLRYMLVQVLSTILSTLYATSIAGLDFPAPKTDTNLLRIWQQLCAELVMTFAMTTVFLHVLYSRQKNEEAYAFARGMIVLASSFSVGGFTGGAFNPAVATGIQLVRCITGDCTPLIGLWIYWVAPFGGAFIAAILYRFLDTEPKEDTNPSPNRLGDFH
jgi:glycerol uptake facilitator-like aquaporin